MLLAHCMKRVERKTVGRGGLAYTVSKEADEAFELW
jgi:hypothetical protein